LEGCLLAESRDEVSALSRTSQSRFVIVALLLLGPHCALAQDAPAVDPAFRKLTAANGLLSRQQYAAAIQEFSDLLLSKPAPQTAAAARFGLGLAWYQQGRFPNAIESLNPLMAEKSFPRREDALAMLGHCYLSMNQPDKALVPIDLLLTEFPKGPQAESSWINRGQVLYRLASYKDALAIAQAFPKVYPASGSIPTAVFLEALCQHAMGQNDAALAAAKRFIAAYPNSPQLYDVTLLQGQCLEGQGKLSEALAIYEKMAADGPAAAKPAAYYAIGIACQQAGRYPAAADSFAAIIRDFPNSSYVGMARVQAGIVQLRSGDTPGARQTFATIQNSDSAQATSAAYWLARCDMADNQYAAAKVALTKLLSAAADAPEKPRIVFDIASCDLALHNYQPAADAFATFRANFPRDEQAADSIYQQAVALFGAGKYPESLTLCEQIQTAKLAALQRPAALLAADNLVMLARYPQAARALAQLAPGATSPAERAHIAIRLGQCGYYAGAFADAVNFLKPVLADDSLAKEPLYADATFLLGDAQLRTKDYAAAAATLARYVSISQDRPQEAVYKLGVAQRQAGDSKLAMQTLSTLLKGPPDSPWVQRAWLDYGQMAYQNKQTADASAAFAKVLEAQAPADLGAPALYTLARMDMEAGRFSDAALKFAEVSAKFPKHDLAADAQFQNAAALKEAGKFPEALAACQAYLQQHADGRFATQARQLQAVCLTNLGKSQDAITQLASLAGTPATRTDTVLYDLAWAQRSAKDDAAALETYRQLMLDFPTSPRYTAVQVESAELLYESRQYPRAMELLQSVIANKDAPPRTVMIAEYRMALCYGAAGQLADAATAFDAFATAHPNDAMAPAAMYQSALALIALNKLGDARQRLESIVNTYPADVNASLATLKMGELLNQDNQYAAAQTAFTTWLKDHPKDNLAPLAEFGIGWSLENRQQYDQARQWYAKVLDHDVTATAARAQFQIGETYFAEKKFDVAAKELLKVDILYTYPLWSSRALYEAGRCFEQLKQLDQAKTQYSQCVQKFKETDIATLARKRLEALNAK
jgi:cellulose synthase operon protein C